MKIFCVPLNAENDLQQTIENRPQVRTRPVYPEPQTVEGYELDAQNGEKDIQKVLDWINKGGKARDLSPFVPESPFPRSITATTLASIASSSSALSSIPTNLSSEDIERRIRSRKVRQTLMQNALRP